MSDFFNISNVIVCIVVLLFAFLSQMDLRLLDGSSTTTTSQASVTNFYNQFGGMLMNDAYHHLFEYFAMQDMIAHCGFEVGDNIVEIGPGSGFLADKIVKQLNEEVYRSSDLPQRTLRPSFYYSIEVSSTMYDKASNRVKHHILSRQTNPVLTDIHMNLVDDSLQFASANISFPVDKIILTYVMDLMPPDHLRGFVEVFSEKLRSKDSKVCVVNLTYGFTPLSRVVTNLWQILYVALGGHRVGGCRPLNILDYFNAKTGFEVRYKNNVVSAGLPSEVAIIHKL